MTISNAKWSYEKVYENYKKRDAQINWNEDESRDIDLYGYPDFEKRLRDVVVNLVEMANPNNVNIKR